MLSLFNLTAAQITAALWVVLQCCSCSTQNLFSDMKGGGGAVRSQTDSVFFSVNAAYQYTIRKDDKISISVWDHDELSVGSLYGIYNSNEVYGKWLLVDARGEINVPKIGPFKIQGLTVLEAQDSLRFRLGEWIRNPIVDVKVLNKEVTMLGEFKTPGKVLLEKNNNTLIELIGKAGDFDFYANKRKIQVLRTVKDQLRQINIDLTRSDNYLARNIQLIAGDVVYVPSKRGKDFDKRITTILPFVSIITAVAISYSSFQ